VYIEDLRFYCYLRGATLKQLLGNPEFLDAIIEALAVPGKRPQLRRLTLKEKLDLVVQHGEHLRTLSSSLWRGVDLPEMLAGAIWQSRLSNRAVSAVFSAVRKESELAAPAAAWLKQKNLKVYAEVPTGTKRPDLLGYRAGGFWGTDQIVAVELKNEVAQLKRGLDQMTTFGEYAHQVYLACTPAMAADYLARHANAPTVKHWDARLLENKLKEFGIGLLLVSVNEVAEVIGPRSRNPRAEKVKEVAEVLRGRTEL
jgi:hypothetical protein